MGGGQGNTEGQALQVEGRGGSGDSSVDSAPGDGHSAGQRNWAAVGRGSWVKGDTTQVQKLEHVSFVELRPPKDVSKS